MAGEERTRQVFGDYVSIYNFKQSADDGATVPLYYENRVPELQLTNDQLNADMERVLEAAELDEAQEGRLEREFAREYHLITRDDRLEIVAEDVVAHFMGRGFAGKAMVVSVDKLTAVRMYEKVRKHWQSYLHTLKERLLATGDGATGRELRSRIAFMEQTDLAVVVSQSQNEVADFERKGLDIRLHRRRMVTEDPETKFKDPADPLRIVFVCAVWMTGFDVPSCSTIYLDKPMRNHTLMQTIARANRVFQEKVNGLIVDYAGIFRDLQRALAIYGSAAGGGIGEGDLPVQDKVALVEQLRRAMADATAFCTAHGVDLARLQAAQGYERFRLRDDAVEAIIVNDDAKKRYLSLADAVDRLFRAILPDPVANDLAPARAVLHVIAEQIRTKTPIPDISAVMGDVDALLDESIAAEGYVIRERPDGRGRTVDLSRIDFEALRHRFERGRKRLEAERLRSVITAKLGQMVRLNRSRGDYLERFQRLIDEYNAGSCNVEEFFDRLLAFVRELDAEEQRGIAEQLSEEELAMFDLLTRPEPALRKREAEAVKKVARDLLATLKREKLVLDWRKRQQARAAVRDTIEEILDRLPAVYTPNLYRQKCDAVYQHVYDCYYGEGRGIYALAS